MPIECSDPASLLSVLIWPQKAGNHQWGQGRILRSYFKAFPLTKVYKSGSDREEVLKSRFAHFSDQNVLAVRHVRESIRSWPLLLLSSYTLLHHSYRGSPSDPSFLGQRQQHGKPKSHLNCYVSGRYLCPNASHSFSFPLKQFCKQVLLFLFYGQWNWGSGSSSAVLWLRSHRTRVQTQVLKTPKLGQLPPLKGWHSQLPC